MIQMINFIFMILPTIMFIVGFYLGVSIKINEKLPEIKTPMQIIEEKKVENKEKKEKEVMDLYLENIDNYPNNQKEIKEQIYEKNGS